jgi:hypothetical protein
MGVPDSEIAKFANPLHWLEFFPPIAMVTYFPFSAPGRVADREE